MGNQTLQSDIDKVWLVRSGSQILGPFSQFEIANQLRQRNLNTLDEVKGPGGRWRYLRETPSFESIIKQIMIEQASGIGSRTAITEEKTKSDIDRLDDLTPTPQFSDARNQVGKTYPLQPIPEPPIKDVSSTSLKANEQGARGEVPKSFAAEIDKNKMDQLRFDIDQEARGKKNFFAWATVGIIVIGVYFFWGKQKSEPGSAEKISALENIESYQKSGRISEAAQIIQKNFPSLDLEVAALRRIMPVISQSPELYTEGLRVVEKILTFEQTQKSDKRDLNFWRAILSMRLGQYEQAERMLAEALADEGNSPRILLNRSWALLKIGKVESAEQQISQLNRNYPGELLSILSAAVALESKDADKRKEVLRELKGWGKGSRKYYWANAIYSVGLAKAIGQTSEVEAILSQMIQQFPTEIEAYLPDWEVALEVALPQNLGKVLERSVEGMDTVAGLAAQSLSAYFTGDLARALTLVDQARKQYANDLDLVALQMFYFWKAQRPQEAKALSKFEPQIVKNLRSVVEAELYLEESDLSGFESVMKSLSRADMNRLVYLDLKARGALKANHKNQSERWIAEGLKIADNYKPLLKLRGQMSE